MFSNYKAAGLLSAEYAGCIKLEKLANLSTSAAHDEATLLYLIDAGVKVISCLFGKLN